MAATDAASGPRSIVIAMDGSKQSEFALKYYKDAIAQDTDDVTVVFAAEHGQVQTQPMMSTDPQYTARLTGEEDGEVKKRVDKLKTMLENSGVKGKVLRYSANTPGEAVVQAARDLNAELIVTGTRGLGTIRRTIMGSVSSYIVHHAHVPVLICREK